MKTVSNTTPILSLSSIGKVEILKDIFQEVIIPQGVYEEIKAISEVKPLLDEMISKGRWYSNRVYYSFLKTANEL